MQRLIRNGAVRVDPYTLVREAATLADLPEATPVIVPLPLWHKARAALVARGDAGVWLAPGDDPATLAPDVARVPVIAVDFPAFTDGRGYSTARLLRERYGYTGELRAIGDVQRDQLYYLHQSGFDAFALRDDKDAAEALAGLRDFSDGYQHTQRRAPWFLRREARRGDRVRAAPRDA
jgi:uncharacterized protein (DUF934 family)